MAVQFKVDNLETIEQEGVINPVLSYFCCRYCTLYGDTHCFASSILYLQVVIIVFGKEFPGIRIF
ncbi:hypothetical protein Dtox_2347 [Desulfofarcimen acetoxidans DSM 771]|uniref:Uncharacterized protein n=1 Tax=Desulfofarcimen acetoxidans (strain ATCC 49208 / DSM 771 / KCTC 5769 / VKM B-1644 / 5575) TaxID=485916 RepID=C8W0A3_DESAS|nr:hypothetical protein Dtox_2347 [Desulfofarcimen acetoxidans DSM 771]